MTSAITIAGDIGVVGAFLGGLLALLSPCSALLLPSFFAVAFTSWRSLLLRAAAFLVGLMTVLVPLGAGVGAIGSLLTRYRGLVTTIGGITMVVLGVAIVFGFGFAIHGVANRLGRLNIGSPVSVAALGALYGLAGFCAGPLLGAVLTIAIAGGSAVYGGVLMAVYAIGMAAPLLVLALLWDRFRLSDRRWLRGRRISLGPIKIHTTSLVTGVLFAGIGALFLLTDGTASVGSVVGVDTQFHLQRWIRDAAGGISDIWVLLAITLAVLAALLIRIAVLAKPPPAEPETPSEPTSGQDDRSYHHAQ